MASDGFDELVGCGIGPIADMAAKCEGVLSTHSRALVSVSGGSDSDVMVDLVERVRAATGTEVAYVWFDTGLEYRATREHLTWLEERYGIGIERRRAERPIPTCCREFGQPFLSKYASGMIEALQSVGFGFEDEPYDVLLRRYGAQTSALKWWTNGWTRTGEPGWYDIGSTRWLKEFMAENPPTFPISARCCEFAKKRVSHAAERESGADVVLLGVRRAEGGIRASHKTCFDRGGRGIDTYRPLFWLADADKAAYDRLFGIRHSDCYEVWGFRRTGCVGCPFNSRCLAEIGVAGRYEPGMERAARRVFADSYEYTAEFDDYRDFRRRGMRRLF